MRKSKSNNPKKKAETTKIKSFSSRLFSPILFVSQSGAKPQARKMGITCSKVFWQNDCPRLRKKIFMISYS